MGLFNELTWSLSNISDAERVLSFFDRCELCRGQSDDRFIAYVLSKKGKIMDHTGFLMYTTLDSIVIICGLFKGTKCVAYLEKHSTIRCEVLVNSELDGGVLCCFWCKNYQKAITDPSSNTPFRYLKSPEKAIQSFSEEFFSYSPKIFVQTFQMGECFGILENDVG